MIGTIRHRGPDGTGIYSDGSVGLAHARLSIIDVAGGSQPMQIADNSLWITFNGEIFNYLELRAELIQKGHRFATRSDTEVILHLYQEEGEKCVERLNGQWAFAIWDSAQRRLFLSRDRLGIRPLFYTQTENSFLFASEAKAMFAHPKVECQLDLQALDQIFTFWVTLPSRTAFRKIQQLPPGHSLVVENDQVRISKYWHLNFSPEIRNDDDEQKCADELLALLTDATRIRLRSDVPVGAYLSGGLDSTYVTALAKQTSGARVRTFSVSFEDTELDESRFQHEASSFLKTEHSFIRCSREDIAKEFSKVVWHAEQPMLRTAPTPLLLLSKLARDSGCKVVLTGEGADEVLGGYDIFKEAKIRRFWAKRPDSSWRYLLLKRLYPYMNGIQRQSPAYLKRFFEIRPEDLQNPFFSHLPRWKLAQKIKTFLSADVRAEIGSYSSPKELADSLPDYYAIMDPFNQAEYLETTLLLPGYILSSQGDRVAMANGVEARYPFLDYRVVEFAAKLSPALKMKVLREKHLLRREAAGLIPQSIQKRYKQPYRAPDGCSFFGSDAGFPDILSPENIKRNGIFDSNAVTELVRKFRRGTETSVADNMAFVGVLSTELLLNRFVNQSNCPNDEVLS